MDENKVVLVGAGMNCGLSINRVDLESLGKIIHNSPEEEIVEIYKSPMFGLSLAYDMYESEIIYKFNKHLEDLKEKSKTVMFIDRNGRH